MVKTNEILTKGIGLTPVKDSAKLKKVLNKPAVGAKPKFTNLEQLDDANLKPAEHAKPNLGPIPEGPKLP